MTIQTIDLQWDNSIDYLQYIAEELERKVVYESPLKRLLSELRFITYLGKITDSFDCEIDNYLFSSKQNDVRFYISSLMFSEPGSRSFIINNHSFSENLSYEDLKTRLGLITGIGIQEKLFKKEEVCFEVWMVLNELKKLKTKLS